MAQQHYYVIGLSASENDEDAPLPPHLESLILSTTPTCTILDQKTHGNALLIECCSSQPEASILAHLEQVVRCHAETYVSAPCRIPIRTWTAEQLTADAFSESGLTVFPNAVSDSDVRLLRSLCATRIAKAHAVLAANHAGIDVGRAAFAFKEIASRGLERFDLLLSANDNPDDVDIVARIVQNGVWMPLIRKLLHADADDDDARPVPCAVSVVYSRPGADTQSWHADGVPASPPYAVCVFLPLVDLTHETGYTQFWPGTQASRGLLGFGPAAEVCGATFDGMVSSGSAVVYDYGTLHRGLGNNSGEIRPVLQVVYHVPEWKDTKNYGTEILLRE
ncbi:hypothetical protein HDU87_003713 [Geranomyces variabilis]|uniref:Phytanoyl-CoA dioxygenase n=1 Tax=Geranomyces variabilis TaxID=109894 RepID=A0AAD5TJH4_9FUNG|nr:hypothetical protein HDU87_003713 [Geranomyces variabilis]